MRIGFGGTFSNIPLRHKAALEKETTAIGQRFHMPNSIEVKENRGTLTINTPNIGDKMPAWVGGGGVDRALVGSIEMLVREALAQLGVTEQTGLQTKLSRP